MLTKICKELNNWFNYNQPKHFGVFEIKNGVLVGDYGLQTGQHYRIVGSVFNDGVHQQPDDQLTDETFDGAIWLMAVPPEVQELAEDISAWIAKYQTVDSPAMSPFISESFGGYSYSKSGASGSDGKANLSNTWQGVFADRLTQWRKIRP